MESILKTSVAMAAYKGEKYILEQLKSIEEQTVMPDEVVIVDDCSPDRTVRVVKEYASKSKLNIKIFENEYNLGFRKNFEKATSLCRNEVIFFCDQDDVWKNNKVEVFIREFQQNENLVYAFSDAEVTDEKLNVFSKSVWELFGVKWNEMNKQEFFDKIQSRYFPLGFSVAVKKNFLEKIVPFQIDHDGWVALCAPTFGEVKAICEKLVYYRRHSNATSSAAKVEKKSKIDLINNIFKKTYREYWIWPDCEYESYSFINTCIKENKANIDSKKLLEHLEYLRVINCIKDRNLFLRIWSLLKLYRQGLFAEYRGGKNTLLVDCLFMIVNSFKAKSKR